MGSLCTIEFLETSLVQQVDQRMSLGWRLGGSINLLVRTICPYMCALNLADLSFRVVLLLDKLQCRKFDQSL